MDGVSMDFFLMDTFRQYDTEYTSPERGSQLKGRNRQGYQQRSQQGGACLKYRL